MTIPEWIPKSVRELKPVKGIDEFAHKQYKRAIIFYRRKSIYAECLCSECGMRYEIRTKTTGDPFLDDSIWIEMPEREGQTKCRLCNVPAVFMPAGKFRNEYRENHICTGQKISDDKFVFRIFYSAQYIRANRPTEYRCEEYRRIYTEKGKKPVKYEHNALYGWQKSGTGDTYAYIVHPQTKKEIKKTAMYKYVPECEYVKGRYRDDCWMMDYYTAAARYPDMEMIVKTGLEELALNLVQKYPVNFNPRGKQIHDRLRINKERLPKLIAKKGRLYDMRLYQLERKYGKHWTDEELEIIEMIYNGLYVQDMDVLKYINPVKTKNYMMKQGIWPGDRPKNYSKASGMRREYYDYLLLRAASGYDMTDDIILYPKDIHRRHNEIVIEREKVKADERKKEVLKKYPKIKGNYEEISEIYSAAAAGYIIRPAKDAAEIVSEGRILHHCVGAGETYLSRHNKGTSFILFLRKAKEPDVPFVTVEIEGEQIRQWYGAYDKKPQKEFIDAWLKTYVEELKKHKSAKNVKKQQKTA